MSRETTIAALRSYKERHGQPAIRKLLNAVAGVDSFSEVPDEKLADLERAAREGAGEEPGTETMLDANGALNVSAIYGKWNAARRRPAS